MTNKNAAEVQLWEWFAHNHHAFEDPESDITEYLDAFYTQLKAIDENLIFEISFLNEDVKELIISANGVLDSFLSVSSLVEKAPEIEGWKITAFRPRMGTDFTISFDEEDFLPEEVYFSPCLEAESLDLIFYVKDAEKKGDDTMSKLCYALLDTALGEYDAVTKIRNIDYLPLPPDPEVEGLFPYKELANYIDGLYYNKN